MLPAPVSLMPLLTLMRVKTSQLRISALAGWSIFRTRVDDLSAHCAVRPTDDFPLACLVCEPVPDLELHWQDRAGGRGCGVGLLLGPRPSHPDYASSREEDLVRTAMRTDEGILLPALGAPDGLFTPPTRTFEGVAQMSTASTRADGRGTFLAEPDVRRVETLEVHERPANIDPKGRPSVHHIPCLESRSAARAAPWPALPYPLTCQGAVNECEQGQEH